MPFQKGQSGNPAGRPREPRHGASVRIREILERSADALANKAVETALAGNAATLRLCLDRLIRVGKYEPPLLQIPPLKKAADAVRAFARLASAAAAGDVTADEAAKFAKVISLYVAALEAHDFEERLTNLERADVKQAAYYDREQYAQSPKAEAE